MELHAVFATSAANVVSRVSDPLSWQGAQSMWSRLDDDRRAGLMPHVKHFEVRMVEVGPDRPLVGPEVRSHGKYDTAKVNMNMARKVTNSRGFGKVEDAARAAWKLFAPTFTVTRRTMTGELERHESDEQGRGGWFYWPNGRTVAQGLDNLARTCQSRNMVVQGLNGRWYVVDPTL